jgi:hypothetical protein
MTALQSITVIYARNHAKTDHEYKSCGGGKNSTDNEFFHRIDHLLF